MQKVPRRRAWSCLSFFKYFIETLCHVKIVKVKFSVSFRFLKTFCAVKLNIPCGRISHYYSLSPALVRTELRKHCPHDHCLCATIVFLCEILQNSYIVKYGQVLHKILNLQNV